MRGTFWDQARQREILGIRRSSIFREFVEQALSRSRYVFCTASSVLGPGYGGGSEGDAC
jgi:hypothetical protein